ncbi:Global nitrogen regulator [Paraliobacillus sp. PM-2]|uniref:Crp/Fnr family transcriptional regulator n=1 Tax=Paraliobacillus sp. PM-2 TaxID=1462524 RepID=UPI00061B9877|nr:Crp/Fnr family transcriptional regulator [Paraliobacillus sp. PM-2]CQR46997.1 Global nitrogen regulator [Paraliobacillus sp. PM-2]
MSDDVIHMLKLFPLFRDLSNEELQLIKSLLRFKKYKKGTHIFMQEEPLSCIYFIKQGRVKIYKNDINGRVQIVNILTQGEMFPHQGFFRHSHYPANAEAMDELELFSLPITSFESLLSEKPTLSVKLIYILGNLIVDLQNRLEEQILHNSFEQIVMLLLRLGEKHGIPSHDDWIIINQPFSNQELANMIGSSRETVSRTLSQLKKQQAIKKEETGLLSIQSDKLDQLLFVE